MSDEMSDGIEIQVRTAEEIATRLVILASVVRRAMIETPFDLGAPEGESAIGMRFDLQAALAEPPYAAAIGDEELEVISAAIGELGDERAISAIWNIGGIMTLAGMSMEGFDIGPPWEQADPGPLLELIPEPWDNIAPFVSKIAPPADDDAAFERERAELWAWRAAIDDDLRALRGPDLAELRDVLAETVAEAVEAGLLRTGSKDFVVVDRPFRELDDETKSLIGAISLERLRALNWLCGFGANWDTVPLEI